MDNNNYNNNGTNSGGYNQTNTGNTYQNQQSPYQNQQSSYQNQQTPYQNQQSPYQNQQYQQSPYQPYQNRQSPYRQQSPYGPNNPDPGQGKGVAAMVLGICSILTCSCYGIVGLVTGIIGLYLAKQSKECSGGFENGFAKAGRICSLVGVILSALMIVYLVICFCLGFGFAFYDYSSFY